MKVKDLLKSIATTLKIELPAELIAKLEDELPENFDTEFTKNFLTRDRAKSDDEIITEITKKSNKTALTAVDEQIKEFLPLLSDEAKQKINSVFSTPEKIKLLKAAIDETMTKQKGKAADADIRKVEDEWQAKFKALQDQAKAEKDLLTKQMEDKNFDFYATSKLSAYNVAEPFKSTREQINAMAIMALKQKGYTYELENGEIKVRQIKDGVTRDVFEGDKKVTFESLIDAYMTPFIAKSVKKDDELDTEVKILIPIDGKEDLHTIMLKNANNQKILQV
jgi:hypothetical protein